MIPPTTAQLHLWPCGYRIKCTAPDCRNLARIIVRYVEDGGAPSGQAELCNKDAKVEIEAAKAKRIAVHDMRE
ncbi:MAG TPA: hypothetical protein VMS08_01140 [Candidatus Saccharimonadia bacterium]|nr:hypothetical protein [Candidatus Saccharimonadia bacterium]